MFKKCEIVLLESINNSGIVSIGKKSGIMEKHLFQFEKGGIYNNHNFYNIYITYVYNDIIPNIEDYYISRDGQVRKVKKYNGGLIYYNNDSHDFDRIDEIQGFIIACKDKSIKTLPSIPDSIIDEYVKIFNSDGDNLKNVLVEFEPYHGINTSIAEVNAISGDGSLGWKGRGDYRDFRPKINKKNNTITIKPIKDSFTKEEVFEMLKKHSYFIDNLYRPYTSNNILGEEFLEEWIEKNL